MQIQPLSPALGAEIDGLDLSRDLDNEAFAALHRAFLDHGVLFFRDQRLSAEAMVRLAGRFGPAITHPMMRSLDGHPEILEIVKNAGDRNNFGGSWHTDLSYLERPPMASLLYAREVPAVGGDTLFADMYAAYQGLSAGLRRLLDGLRAVHDTTLIYTDDAQQAAGTIGDAGSMRRARPKGQHERVVHPVVRTHPETGRRALYVNCNFTTSFENMSAAESAPLLGFLFRHMERPELTCRFRWTPGAVALWDNRRAQHYALNDYHGHRRSMYRIAIEGDRPA